MMKIPTGDFLAENHMKGELIAEMNDTIKISEIYETIMGESTYNGLPCTLIRMAGCNLRLLYMIILEYCYQNTLNLLMNFYCHLLYAICWHTNCDLYSK